MHLETTFVRLHLPLLTCLSSRDLLPFASSASLEHLSRAFIHPDLLRWHSVSVPSDPKTSRAEPAIGISSMMVYDSRVIESWVASISIHDRNVLILATLLVKSVIHLSLAGLNELFVPGHVLHDGKLFSPKHFCLLQLTLLCLFILLA